MGKDLIILGGLLVSSYFVFGKKKTTTTTAQRLNGLNGNCRVCGSSDDDSTYLSVRGECKTGDYCSTSFPKTKTLLLE